jgi:hypothetical protein
MSVRSEILDWGQRVTRGRPLVGQILHKALSIATHPDLVVLVTFAAVGLLLTFMLPVSADTAMQGAPLP